MADILQSRYGQLLRRLFALKSVDTGRQVTPQIVPSVEIADGYQPENRVLRGERLWSVMNSMSNTAGTSFGLAVINNPTSSGKLCVIKRAWFGGVLPTAANQPGNVFAYINKTYSNPAAVTVNGAFKDGRLFNVGAGVPSCGYSGGNSGSFSPQGTTFWAERLLCGAATAQWSVVYDACDLVIAPGLALVFGVGADVLPVATWAWDLVVEAYERIADPGELLAPPQ